MRNKESFSKHITYFFNAIFIIGLCCLIFYLNHQVKVLEQKEIILNEKLYYEQIDSYEILTCPICGSEGKIHDVSNKKFYIRCKKCGYESYSYPSVQETIDMWNSITRQN